MVGRARLVSDGTSISIRPVPIVKRQFKASYDISRDDFRNEACMSLPKAKECQELYDTFDTLQIWQDVFREKLGALTSITHHSNPDDPPDAVAMFTHAPLEIELTSIEPEHVMEANSIHRGNPGFARNRVPVSGGFDRSRSREIKYTPGHSLAWETNDASLQTRFRLIMTAIARKLRKHRSGGLLLLQGEMTGDLFEDELICAAFRQACKMPEAEKWMFGFKYRWNPGSYFSVLCANDIGIMTRRSHLSCCTTKAASWNNVPVPL